MSQLTKSIASNATYMEKIEIRKISKTFNIVSPVLKRVIGKVKAVDDVSFTINRGEMIGLVGESGSGKTTLGKIIAGILSQDSGEIYYDEQNIKLLNRRKRAKKIQMIFQDPLASLNPRLSVGSIIGEAVKTKYLLNPLKLLTINGKESLKQKIQSEVTHLLHIVGLNGNIVNDYPHQFSGGQRQRIAIARALAMEPELIIADEPVSCLDLSVQAQIINLFIDLKDKFNLSYIFISHDIVLVGYLCDRILVMSKGKIVEQGETRQLFTMPQQDYTKHLLAAIISK